MKREKKIRLRWSKPLSLFLLVLFVVWPVQTFFAQSSETLEEEPSKEELKLEDETEDVYGTFGGPDSTQKRMESDRASKGALFEFDFLKPYYVWKEDIREKYGYSFTPVYVPVYLKSNERLPGKDDHAAGGAFRFFNSWELLGRGTDTTGTLNCLFEYRHNFGNNTPNEYSIGNLGNAGFIQIPHEHDQWHLTHLYWSQSWNSGDYEAVGGYLDITDFVDTWALTSPWTDFFNYAFSIGAGSIDIPNDATLGAAAGAYLSDNFYIIGGFEDLNSDPTDPLEGFDTFWKDHEFFKHLEFGWTSSKDMYYYDNVHLTFWHADERDEIGVDAGWGAVFSLTHTVADHWLPFIRGGFAKDGGSLLEKSVSAGVGYQLNPFGEATLGQFGFGVNWGKPNDALFGAGVGDQGAIEMYYRLQVTKELAITPSVQVLIDPALHPDEDSIWVFGLRARIAF